MGREEGDGIQITYMARVVEWLDQGSMAGLSNQEWIIHGLLAFLCTPDVKRLLNFISPPPLQASYE